MLNSVANEIIHQLGGNKFIVMTGAKDFVELPYGIQFRIGSTYNTKINMVRVFLNTDDTYGMQFIHYVKEYLNSTTGFYRPSQEKVINNYEHVYNNNLQEVFKLATGMDTRL